MSAMASQTTSLASVYSTVYSGTSKKISKLRVTGLCEGNSPGTFPAQRASRAEKTSIGLRHFVGKRGPQCLKKSAPVLSFSLRVAHNHPLVSHRVGLRIRLATKFKQRFTKWKTIRVVIKSNSLHEATLAGIILCISSANERWRMGPIHNDLLVYSDSMSCLQPIEGEDTEDHFICHTVNLLWLLSDRGIRVHSCWIPGHFGIEGNTTRLTLWILSSRQFPRLSYWNFGE